LRPCHINARSASSRGVRTSSAPQARIRAIASSAVRSTSARTPSTSIRSAAPASSGQSTPVALTIASIASRSHISIAAGTIPAPMIADTAAPAPSVDANVAKTVRVASGERRMRTTASVTIPRSPSLPTRTPMRSYPSASAWPSCVPISTTLPSASTSVTATAWFTVKPYFKQCAPPEFSAMFPPIVQTLCEEGSGA
jgi:hypothetical protein